MVVLGLFNIKKELTTRNNIFEEFKPGTVSHVLKFGIFNNSGPQNQIKFKKM